MRDRRLIRYVIFDLDGTLVDSCAICVAILSDILADRGSDHVIDPIDARRHMSRGGMEMVSALLGPHCIDPASDLGDFRARYQVRQTPADSLFPGVADNLAKLRAMGLELAICSNKPQNLCERVLEDTGLARYFSVVIGGQPNLRPKPALDLLDAVFATLGCDAEECLYVGDSELDHQVAQAAALPFYFMTYGYAEEGWAPTDCESYDCFHALTNSIIAQAAPANV